MNIKTWATKNSGHILSFLIGIPLFFLLANYMEHHRPKPLFIDGHEIVTIGHHQYIKEQGFLGPDALTHFEDCNNPIHNGTK